MWTNTSDFFLTKEIISFKERVGRFWEMCFPNVIQLICYILGENLQNVHIMELKKEP
jgi:hypothetical protein